MSRITYEETDLRRALAEEGLRTDAIARVLDARAQVAIAEPPAAETALLGIGASGFAVLLGVVLALASLVAFAIALEDAGRPALVIVSSLYLLVLTGAIPLLARRLARGARAMLGLGAAAAAAYVVAALVADRSVITRADPAGAGLLGERASHVAMALAAFAVGALCAARLRVPPAWNVAGVLLAALLISPFLVDDPPMAAILGAGVALVAVGEVVATRLGRASATGAATAGAVLVAIGVMGTLDSIWGLAIAGVAMLATGLVTARAGVLGAGALLFWMGIAVIVIDRAGSPVVVAAGLLVAAAAVVAIGIGLASARRRAALEARLEPPWRRR